MSLSSLVPPAWQGNASESNIWKLVERQISRFEGNQQWRMVRGRLVDSGLECTIQNCPENHPFLQIDPHRPSPLVREVASYTVFFCGPSLVVRVYEPDEDYFGSTYSHIWMEDIRFFTGVEAPSGLLGPYISLKIKSLENQNKPGAVEELEAELERRSNEVQDWCEKEGKLFLEAPDWTWKEVDYSTLPTFIGVESRLVEKLEDRALKVAGYRERWPAAAVKRILLVVGDSPLTDKDLRLLGWHLKVLNQPVTSVELFEAANKLS